MKEEPCLSAVSVEAPSGVLFRTPSRAEQPYGVLADSSTPLTQESGSRSAAAAGSTAAVAEKRAGTAARRLVQHTCTPLAASLARKQKGGTTTDATRTCNNTGRRPVAGCPSLLSGEAFSRYQESPSPHAAYLLPGGASIALPPAVSLSPEHEIPTAAQHNDGLSNGSHSSSPSHKVNVKVLVRCRPMTREERRSGCSVVDVAPERKEVTVRLRRGSGAVRTAAASLAVSPPAAAASAGTAQKPPALLQNSQHTTSSSSSATAGLEQGLSKVFRFDGVCALDTTQQQLFDEHVRPLVDDVLQGFNCTVFAYGQTGTGKTFTIEGAAPPSSNSTAASGGGQESSLNAFHSAVSPVPLHPAGGAAAATSSGVFSKAAPAGASPREAADTQAAAASCAGRAAAGAEGARESALLASSLCLEKYSPSEAKSDTTLSPASECGLIPRAVDHIFTTLRRHRDPGDFTVTCSFLEIYNEELIDLFASPSAAPLQQGNTTAENASSVANGQQSGLPSKETRTTPEASSAIAATPSSSSSSSSSYSRSVSSTASNACGSPLPTTSGGCRLRIYEEPATPAPGYASGAAECSSPAVASTAAAASRPGGGAATLGGSRAGQQNSRGAIKVEGLEDKEVKTADEVFALLRAAAPRRAFARSSMNAHSSRSHTVFSISVCVKEAVRAEETSLLAPDPGATSSSSELRSTRCIDGKGNSSSGASVSTPGNSSSNNESSSVECCSSSNGGGGAGSSDSSRNSRRLSSNAGGTDGGSAGSARRKGQPVDFARAAANARRVRRGRGGSADPVAAAVCGRTGALPVEEVFRVGKLNLVDLAGSENVYRSWGGGTATGAAAAGGGSAEEKRRRECTLINKSLLTLGRCINALVEHASYIPYRDSKLTRLLQDSLGGCTKTCLIATISPAEDVVEETLNTLNYAYRAKSIQNLPVKTLRHSKSSLLSSLLAQNQQLQLLLASQRERDGVFLPVPLFQQQQQQHALLQQQSQEQQRDIVSLQQQIETLQEAEQRMRQSLEEQDAERQQLQQQTKRLQSELVAAQERQQQLEQHLQTAEEQRQALAKRLSEKLQQHVLTTGAAAADLRRAVEEATVLERHRWLLQDREQRVRHTCEGSAAGADATRERLQQQLHELHERLLHVLKQLEENEAARAEAAAVEETVIQKQQQEDLRVRQEQQQLRAKALLQVQHQQQAHRKDKEQQLQALTSAIVAFVAECGQGRAETAARANTALQQVEEKQQLAAEHVHAKLQHQLELAEITSKELQQLLQASSSTRAADAERTCTSLREVVHQVEEWQLQQQRLLEEGAAAVAAAVQHQLQNFAQQQRARVEEHCRKVRLHLQDVQQATLQQREAAAAEAAAAAAAAAAAGEAAAALAKGGKTGVNTLLEEAQSVRAAATAAEREKASAADRAAADRCDQLQRQISAASAAEGASEKEVDAGLRRVLLMDEEALAAAAAAAASNAETWQHQRRVHTQDAGAAAATLLQEASAAAAALHRGGRTALAEQHALAKKCTTHILTHVLQPPTCARGTECLYGRELPTAVQQGAAGGANTETEVSSSATTQGQTSSISENTDNAVGGVCQRGNADAACGSSSCSWCAAAAAGRWWFSAHDGRGTAAAAEAAAAAAAAEKEAAATERPETDNQARLEMNSKTCASVKAAPHVQVAGGMSREAASADAAVDHVLLPDAAEKCVDRTGEDVSGVLCVGNSRVALDEALKQEEQAQRTDDAPAFLTTATFLQEQTAGVGGDETAVQGATAHLLEDDALDSRCREPQRAPHLRNDAGREAPQEPPLQVTAAEQHSCGAGTSRSWISGEESLGTAEDREGAVFRNRTDKSAMSSSRSTERSPLPSRSTTTSSTPRCRSSAASRSNSSTRRDEQACKKFELSHQGEEQSLESTAWQCASQSATEAGDGSSNAPPQQLQRQTQQQQQGCHQHLKEGNSSTAPPSSQEKEEVKPSHKWRAVQPQQSQHHQGLQQHCKLEEGLEQDGGASRLKESRVKLLSLTKKWGPESATFKSQQEGSLCVERQQQRQQQCRSLMREPQRQPRSLQPRVQHYQQREKLSTRETSAKGAGKGAPLGNAGSGAARKLKSLRGGKAALSHPAPQPTLRRSRSGENLAHSEVDKRKKIHDDTTGNTHFDTHFSVVRATEGKERPCTSAWPAGSR